MYCSLHCHGGFTFITTCSGLFLTSLQGFPPCHTLPGLRGSLWSCNPSTLHSKPVPHRWHNTTRVCCQSGMQPDLLGPQLYQLCWPWGNPFPLPHCSTGDFSAMLLISYSCCLRASTNIILPWYFFYQQTCSLSLSTSSLRPSAYRQNEDEEWIPTKPDLLIQI